jgi:hypothetical protein
VRWSYLGVERRCLDEVLMADQTTTLIPPAGARGRVDMKCEDVLLVAVLGVSIVEPEPK